MPKRGGGGGSQRYNLNNGGNAPRYAILKDHDAIEENERRKDRNKRRVSFKPPQTIKLRLSDVRRLEEDDEMGDLATTSTDRSSSRRRGSPIPRGKFAKLMPSTFGWYQVSIHNGQNYEREVLLRALLAAMSPHTFTAHHWRKERYSVLFFTDDFEAAERIQQLGRHAQLPDGFHLNPRVRSGIPLIAIDSGVKQLMTNVMAKRYNVQTKALDLSRFHADPELKQTFCPLFRNNVMSAVLDIICENIPDLEALNMNENNLTTLETFKGIEKRLPHLKILHLADNKLPSLVHFLVFRNLPIAELVLRNNPCRARYRDTQHFVSEVRRKFPKLQKLDGETLAPIVNFDEAVNLPSFKSSFLCDPAGGEIIRQFLFQYINIFDSDNRQPLLDAYHEQAMLSISMPSANQAGRLEKFWKFNRNLRRISNNRDNYRVNQVRFGRLACVFTLNEWPRTAHERNTFTVDLTLYNPQIISFTMTGLFKEFPDPKSGNSENASAVTQTHELRYFTRTLIVVPQNNGYCIRNEMIFITSATPEQQRAFKRSQLQPAPSVLSPPNASDVSLQSRLQLSQSTSVASLAPLPELATSLVPNNPVGLTSSVSSAGNGPTPAPPTAVPDEVKNQMVQAMSAQSNMNFEWSRKCLEETNWNYNYAVYVFDKLFKEGKIPPEAFSK